MMDDDLAMALALQAQEDLAEQQADHNEHETEDDEYRPKRRRVARRNNGSSKRQ